MLFNRAAKLFPLLPLALGAEISRDKTSRVRTLLKEHENKQFTKSEDGTPYIRGLLREQEKNPLVEKDTSFEFLKRTYDSFNADKDLDLTGLSKQARSKFDKGGSSVIQPLGEGVDTNFRPNRHLDSDDCPPFNTAIPLEFDQTGENITFVTGSTVGAPANLIGSDGCVVDSNAPTVWYTFTTTAPVDIVLTTCAQATTFDTTISLYRHFTGDGCSVFCLGQNNDHGSDDIPFCSPSEQHSLAVLESQPDIYYVAVSGLNSFDAGSFALVLFAIGGDDSGTDVPTSTIASGTCEGEFQNFPCSDLFAKETCSACDIDACDLPLDTCDDECGVVPGCGCSLSEGTCGAFLGGSSTILCSGTTDIVCGDFTEAEACDGLSSFGCGWVAGGQSDAPSEAPSESPLPPAEDCPLSTAIVIEYDPLGMFVAGSTAGAPANLPTEGVCGATPDSPTVWYRFDTEAFAGPFAILTCSALLESVDTTFDTVISVFQGTSSGSTCTFDCVAENDDHNLDTTATDICDVGTHSFLIFEADAFETYYVAVSGFSPTDSGEFILAVLELDV